MGDGFWQVGENLTLAPWGDSKKSAGPSGVAGHLPNCKSLVSVVELEVSEEERSISVFMVNLDRRFALAGSLGGGGKPNSIASSNSSGEDIVRRVLRISGSL